MCELRSTRMLICLHVSLYISILFILQILPLFWIQVFYKICVAFFYLYTFLSSSFKILVYITVYIYFLTYCSVLFCRRFVVTCCFHIPCQNLLRQENFILCMQALPCRYGVRDGVIVRLV